MERFESVWKAWPRRTGKDSACRDWISYVTPENVEAVMACVHRYLASAEVARGVVQNLGTSYNGGQIKSGWIVNCARDGWECDWPQARVVRTKQQENSDLWGEA